MAQSRGGPRFHLWDRLELYAFLALMAFCFGFGILKAVDPVAAAKVELALDLSFEWLKASV
ncbi:hypothetical protein [Halomarina oriensis]|uniref:Uncharacterized protein n=1 Tax=Halomarina oriensis TaxID=671145 RepID=A0A6B0GUT9_9EURY|nr:hypothetical protein [Halomarina oriensis]MWG35905.1 hypothetical protein [Halomarina oriensis]